MNIIGVIKANYRLEVKYILNNLKKEGYNWLSGQSADEFKFINNLQEPFEIYIVKSEDKKLSYSFTDYDQWLNKGIEPECATIDTSIGEMPLVDYFEIEASNFGFDSYDQMRKEGYNVNLDEYFE